MRKILVLTSAIAVLVAVLSMGLAQMPDHPHMLVQAPEIAIIDGEPYVVGWRQCVDLAGGRSVPLNAHHDRVHTGRAGQALDENANIWVIPGAPLTPWINCAELADTLAAGPIPLNPQRIRNQEYFRESPTVPPGLSLFTYTIGKAFTELPRAKDTRGLNWQFLFYGVEFWGLRRVNTQFNRPLA